MARSQELDLLLDFRFHLYDVDPKFPSLYPFVLNPSIGFSSVSVPSLTLDKATITPGNAYYAHKVVKRGTTNTLSLQRGAYLQESDFWRWFLATLTGESGSLTAMSGKRRNLLLVHFSTQDPDSNLKGVDADAAVKTANIPGSGMIQFGSKAYVLLGAVPARAWLLYDCQPASYRAGSDLSATSNAISLREMQIDYSDIDEIDMSF